MTRSAPARARIVAVTTTAAMLATMLAAAAPVAAAGPTGRALAAPPAIGPADAVLTVNSTGDATDLAPGDGVCDTGALTVDLVVECTLRAAIVEANAHPADMAIEFALTATDPGHAAGVWTIRPATRYASLTDPVTIDGASQAGYVDTPVIHLDGSALTIDLANSGVVIDTPATGSVVRGLSITGFGNDGLQTQADDVVVEDNYFGVLPDGITAVGSASEGVIVHGTADGTIVRDNLFGGHPNAAVALNGDTTGSVVQGNRFGTDATGTVSMPNGQSVWSDTTGSALIGGVGPGEGNHLANSGWNAIELHGATARIAIVGNEIVGSGHLAVDLDSDNVVTPNDPGDVDTGTNDLLNFPVLDAAVAAAGTVEIDFTLDVPVGDYRVEFFANPSGLDPTGHGEAEQLVGFTELGHLGGSRSYTASVPGAAGDELTATTTRLAPGPVPDVTSELAAGITVVPATVVTVNSTGDAGDLVPGDTLCDTGGTNSSGSSECTLRAALEEADAAAGPTVVDFAMPVTEPGYQPAPVAYMIAPASPLPLVGQRVVIDATTQPEHASAGRPVVQVDGSSAGPATGLRLSGAGSVVRGLSIGNFDGTGLMVSGDGTVVAGNHIGVDPVGTTETPNTGLGVDVNADDAMIGGTTAADRNVISGNGNTAVSAVGVVDVTVAGNHLGTDVTGLVTMTNGGIHAVSASGDRIRIGGTEPGAGNVIGGYWGGIGLSSGTGSVVEGNLIGVGADGTTPVPNVRGISMGGTGHRIGGPDAAMRNVIANSTQEGISIDSGSDGLVQGNYVGTDATGLTAAPNDNGIRVVGGADHLVGGSAPGEGNLIASNNQRGLLVTGGTGTRIHGNTIRGNGWQGIYASSGAADQVTIGGTGPGEGNTITQSGNIGVVLQVGTYGGITIVGNSIHDNGSIGIDHNWDGVTVNDVGDVDDGPNGLLNHPVMTSALEVTGTVTLDLDLDVPAGDYRLEVFTNPGGTDPSGYGEGEVLVHATTVTHAGLGVETFSTTFAGSAGDVLTATVTEQLPGPGYGSTSEFSPTLTVAAPVAVTVNSTGDGPDLVPGDQSCDTGGANAVGDPECTLRAAIEETNASGLIDRIDFAIPATDPGLAGGVWTIAPASGLPAVTTDIDIDGTSQPTYSSAPVIRLDGAAAGGQSGLRFGAAADGARVRGLMITRFGVDGIVIDSGASGVIVRSNWIGSDGTGAAAMGNGDDGIDIYGSDSVIDRNVVNNSGDEGIDVRGARATITGNIIGLEADGMNGSGNTDVGIALFAGDTVIGGTAPGAGNVISMNWEGIEVNTSGNTIQGNLIGTDATGVGVRGNRIGDGIEIQAGTGNLIGGATPAAANVIAHNPRKGVDVTGGADNAVLGNSIHSNGGLGIDLGPTGVTPNDAGDGDTGANGLLNHPVITSATVTAGIVSLDLELDVPAGDYRVEVFDNQGGVDPSGYGEGQTLRASLAVTHTGSGVESFGTTFSGTEGDLITATVTQDAAGWGPTSEFSAWVGVVDPSKVRVNDAGDASDLVAGDGQCDTGALNVAGAPACTLRAAIEEANASAVVDHIEFLMLVADPGQAGGVWTIQPASGLPAVTAPVTIDATTQPPHVANTSPAPQALDGSPVVQLDGSSAGANQDGLVIAASDTTVRGLVINRFDNDGITVLSGADRFVLTASYLGTTADGLAAAANADDGIDLGGNDAVVGGTDPADRNLLSGNAGDGVEISLGGSGNQVMGNIIGLAADGVGTVANGLRGVEIWEASAGNTIGGTVAGAANLISGNTGDGVRVRGAGTDANVIAGNWIGPDATGTSGPGNNEGVNVFGGASGNVIGPGNVLSANRTDGVYIGEAGTDANRVIGNLIGLTADGTARLSNSDRGVQLETGTTNNVVGGPDAADRNVISGNGTEGIIIADFTASGTTGNQITNNFIGTDQTGAFPVPNTRDGVRVVAAGGNLIGGVSPFDGNLIAHNGQHGVEISATALSDNAITWNRIHSNGGLGIDIGDDGVDTNDAGDGDAGPNDRLNHPVISLAAGPGPTATVTLDFDLQPGDYLFHFHTNASGEDPSGYGEGQSAIHVEALTGHPGGTGSITRSVPVSPGDVVTVTATEDLGAAYGSTSEYSAAIKVAGPTTVVVNSTGDGSDAVIGDGLCDTGAVNVDGDPECTLRAAVEESNASFAINTIDFSIPATDPGHAGGIWTLTPASQIPFITSPVTVDATSQPGWAGDPVVELDGTNAAGASGGLILRTDASTISGFIVHSFADEGLEIDGSTGFGDGNTVSGNWVGVDATQAPRGNADVGVLVTVGAADNVIDGNVVADSGTSGIVIRNVGSDNNVVTANLVGLAPDGTTPVPNTMHGIEIYDQATGNRIGGPGASDTNTVAHNLGDGVRLGVDAGSANSIVRNQMRANGGLGIDLAGDGVTANDPGDGDTGPNGLLNHPEVVGLSELGGIVTATVDLDVPAGTYRLDAYDHPSGADPSGHGEGEVWRATTTLTHPGGGVRRVILAFPGSAGQDISLTVTEDLGPALGATSELSAVQPVLVDSTAFALDSSTRRSDLRYTGGLTPTPTPAVIGSGQEFDGGAARLTGPPTDVDAAGLTLSAWVQPKSLSGSPRLLAKQDGAGLPRYELLIDTTGSPQARARIEVGGTVHEAAGGTVTTGWQHLASTWDGATLRVFIDGTEVAATPAAGALTIDPAAPLVVGNTASASNPLEGRLDEVRVARTARSEGWLATEVANQSDPAGFVSVGALQTGSPGTWTVDGGQTRTGSFAARAPETDALDSWLTANGIFEPGVEFETWWWFSGTSGELAQGVRAGVAPVTQLESALVGPAGWDLGRMTPLGRAQLVAPPAGQTPATGTWTRVTVRIDQNSTMTVLVDDVVLIGPTPVLTSFAAGSLGLRGRLPTGESWYVDDAVARRLVAVEPVTSLGPLDR